jgi:hypothetical protein
MGVRGVHKAYTGCTQAVCTGVWVGGAVGRCARPAHLMLTGGRKKLPSDTANLQAGEAVVEREVCARGSAGIQEE